jgi:hypothetical protein
MCPRRLRIARRDRSRTRPVAWMVFVITGVTLPRPGNTSRTHVGFTFANVGVQDTNLQIRSEGSPTAPNATSIPTTRAILMRQPAHV